MEDQTQNTEVVKRPASSFDKCYLQLIILLIPLSILGGFAVHAVSVARGAAIRMLCCGNMNQQCCAFEYYHDEHGSYPPAYTGLCDYSL